jgi:hypothetical protein
MLDSSALDVAVGLSLIFFLFSVVISRINETIASWTNLRYAGLEKALRSLVGENTEPVLSAKNVLGHPLVRALSGTATDRNDDDDQAAAKTKTRTASRLSNLTQRLTFGNRKLSYLPARTFSAAVLDLLAPAHTTAATRNPLTAAAAAVKALSDTNPAKRPLLRMLADAQGDRDRFRLSLEHWYDDAMDRVSGWYKRNVQRIILVIAIVIVASLNVDTINIAQVLWRVPTERSAVAAAAANQAANGQSGGDVDTSVRGVTALNLPIGWTPAHSGTTASTDPRHVPDRAGSWLVKLLGMLITVLALSLGAPFWFDALSKLSGLGKAGPKPAKSRA